MKETIDNQSSARYDIYALVHKGLRACMCDTLAQAGRTDTEDEKEVSELLVRIRELAAFCEIHLRHENRFIHAALEARRMGSSVHTAEDHRHHEWAIAEIRTLADEVEEAHGTLRAMALNRLYRYLSIFVGDNLVHMNVEETDNNAVLWACYSDKEIMNMEKALVATITPEEGAVSMRWMLSAMTPQQRAAKLTGLRKAMPTPAFDAVLSIARSHLSDKDWHKLSQALMPVEVVAA